MSKNQDEQIKSGDNSNAPLDSSAPEHNNARPSLLDWMELRIGWTGFIRKNLDEPMPPGVGWWQALGNLLLTLLMFQFITGVALAMFYAPTPDHAYQSVKHISDYVWLGVFIRRLHHWGSSVIVVVVILHILRVVFWGSYKKPRELTWMIGVLILPVILGFAFTGYLLPWDQKAYWATKVGTRMAETMPFFGKSLMYLLRGGAQVGAMTLTRFYAVHILILPIALVGLSAFHLYLVRHHHISGPVVPQKGTPAPFYPVQLARDSVVVLVAAGILVSLALFNRTGLSVVANPIQVNSAPRPEWYFLGLFELLKLIPPKLEVLGTIVTPAGIIIGLLMLPWLDRSNSRHPAKRGWIIDITLFVVLGLGALTLKGLLDEPPAVSNNKPVQPAVKTLSTPAASSLSASPASRRGGVANSVPAELPLLSR